MSVVPWVPTPSIVIDYLLHALGVGENDVVADLGCGDGRVLLEFCKYGALGICVELNRTLCNIVEIAAKTMNVRDRIKIYCTDFFTMDFRRVVPRPTIVYLFLYPSTLEQLSHKLETEFDPGTIVVTLDFAVRGWSPFFVKSLVDENDHDRLVWFYAIGISNPSARKIECVNQDELNSIERNLCSRKFSFY
ncbi:MAG: SAM-dependent methyltransferase [Ignisphaera sp.]|nr:SAM-dependent methyltransferase [Ignisphaera sp.]MCX8168524.1 SAM-dependent methyltransferase [Ignisphaera sp.]MDW8085037.1 SAM-dependent methyltransferase [Ignisphaera sp.]